MFSFITIIFGVFELGVLIVGVYLGIALEVYLFYLINGNILFMEDFKERYASCFS
jgi:hypothetical protein